MLEKILKFAKRLAIFLVITIILLEIGLRIFGFGTFELPDFSMKSSPSMHITPDEELGVHLVPGTYQVTINKELKYTATHLNSRQRTCGSVSDTGTLITFYGCSFTYGTGVNDSEVYPYLLQQQFDSLKIENRAVPGYGQAQVLVQLEDDLTNKEKPSILVLNYLPFHNERNTMNTGYQQKIRMGYELTKKDDSRISKYPCSYPYGEMVDGKLNMKKMSIGEINSTFPLISYSAITNTLQNLIDQKSVDAEQDEKVTQAMIREIKRICDDFDVKLVVTYMMNDAETKRMIQFCEEISIPTVDIYVDLNQEGYTNAPHDQHPSPIAHKLFAEKLSTFLQTIQ